MASRCQSQQKSLKKRHIQEMMGCIICTHQRLKLCFLMELVDQQERENQVKLLWLCVLVCEEKTKTKYKKKKQQTRKSIGLSTYIQLLSSIIFSAFNCNMDISFFYRYLFFILNSLSNTTSFCLSVQQIYSVSSQNPTEIHRGAGVIHFN